MKHKCSFFIRILTLSVIGVALTHISSEGMLLYTKDMVRVGGASKSEKLKEFTLKELLEGSNEEKKALRQLESDRDECERRLDQLSG